MEEKKLKDLSFSFHFVTQESIAGKAVKARKKNSAVRTATLAELSNQSPGSLISPRGETEIRENVRQICVFQHAPIGRADTGTSASLVAVTISKWSEKTAVSDSFVLSRSKCALDRLSGRIFA